MAVVYSLLLARLFSAPSGVSALGTPPTGTKWVVKDIVATWSGGECASRGGFRFHDDDQVDIFTVEGPLAMTSYSFHWTGSQVIEYGQSLTLTTGESGWSVRVSGYQLVLP